MENFWVGLVQVNLFLQNLGDWLFVPMRFFSFLGDEEFYLFIMPAIFWCFDSRLGVQVGLLLMLSNGFNAFFKLLFHSPRPFWVSDTVKPMVLETSFGLPSGHAQNAASIWGFFATVSRKLWVKIALIVLIFLIGLSRLYLGAHFLVDVLFGWLLGGLLLWLFLAFFERIKDQVKNWSRARQWLGVVVSTLFILLLSTISLLINQTWKMPVNYQANINLQFPEEAINPLSMDGVITAAAVWFGLLAGLILIQKVIPLGRIRAKPLHLILRFVIGIIGVQVFWAGLKLVFPVDIPIISDVLRFVRYGLVGIWISAGAPYLFKRFGLEIKIKKKSTKRRK